MPSTHPFTIIVGVLSMVFMVAIVALGLICSVYTKDPAAHPNLKIYYEFAKACKLCDNGKK